MNNELRVLEQHEVEEEENKPLYERTASPGLDWKSRFRIIASKASRHNRNPKVYSTTESPIRDELIRLGFKEGSTFLHEWRLLGYAGRRRQSVYYWLDFYLPKLLLAIEADGEIWHNFFDMKRHDRRRDAILRRRYGIKIVRLDSFKVRRKRIGKSLSKIIAERCMELICDDVSSSQQANAGYKQIKRNA